MGVAEWILVVSMVLVQPIDGSGYKVGDVIHSATFGPLKTERGCDLSGAITVSSLDKEWGGVAVSTATCFPVSAGTAVKMSDAQGWTKG